MSYDALRKGRYSAAHRAYFITTNTAQRKPLFTNFHLARIVILEMQCLDKNHHVNSLSWVLMPDHLHWLFQLTEKNTLANVIKTLKARSAKRINHYLKQSGSVWQRNYYDHGLRDNENIRDIARYIVGNPLRARLVDNIGDYPYWDAKWID